MTNLWVGKCLNCPTHMQLSMSHSTGRKGHLDRCDSYPMGALVLPQPSSRKKQYFRRVLYRTICTIGSGREFEQVALQVGQVCEISNHSTMHLAQKIWLQPLVWTGTSAIPKHTAHSKISRTSWLTMNSDRSNPISLKWKRYLISEYACVWVNGNDLPENTVHKSRQSWQNIKIRNVIKLSYVWSNNQAVDLGNL